MQHHLADSNNQTVLPLRKKEQARREVIEVSSDEENQQF